MRNGKETVLLRVNGQNLDRIAERVSRSLLAGNVCIIPTDTLYGIVALDRRRDAVRRVFEIKRRPRNKPFIRLIGDTESLKKYTEQELPASLRKYWPGPLTVVFRGLNGGTVAVRRPDSEFLKKLFELTAGEPLVAPSANLSGEEDIIECGELFHTFDKQVHIIVCGTIRATASASTIVDISGDRWRIVRMGALRIGPDELEP